MPTKIDLIDLIGSGSFGKVYKCKDETGKKFALKTIKYKNEGIECLIEPDIMLKFDHPYLNYANKVYVKDNLLFILQPLGICDMSKWRKTNKVDMNVLKVILYCIIHAVNTLHVYNIVHCDIKASNILVFSDGRVRLCDYTLSRIVSEPFISVVCTPTHRPPESWTGKECTSKVDTWSMICTIYEIITGSLLFEGEEDVMRYVKTGILPHTNNLELNRLMYDTLIPDPNLRPTCKELMNHSFFDHVEKRNIDYKVKTQTCKQDAVDYFTSSVKTQSNHYIYHNATALYLRCRHLSPNVDKLLLKYGCLLITHKLHAIKYSLTGCPFSLEELVKVEEIICVEVGFLLYLCDGPQI
jgi:serine/threonine-protein kinase 11